MTSRILQEDTSLLLTELNEPLTNDTFIGTDSFNTGNSEVGSPTLEQGHTLTAPVLTTGSPESNQATLTQEHTLSPLSASTEAPTVNPTAVTQGHDLAPLSVLTESPVVSDTTMVEGENFTPLSLVSEAPLVRSSSIGQQHALSPDSIQAGFADVDRAPVPEDPVVVQETQEVQQMIGGWQRRAYEVPDGRLVQAEREIYSAYNEKVSIDQKAKSLVKFGRSAELTADTKATVWTVGGNETYVTDNSIEFISSSNANDDQEIYLECHTVSGTGTDSKFTFLTQTVTLNGQTPVALPTPVARVSYAANNNGTELEGRVTVYEQTTLSGGVPTDASKIHIDIPIGLQASLKAATTFSDNDYYILTGGFGSVSKKQDANADFYLEVRQAGKVFLQQAAISASRGGPWVVELDPAVIIPSNADVRITCDADSNGAIVFGVFKGYLAKVI